MYFRLIIWFLCELMVFQPNVYDNNKLLLAAYMLICCFVAGAVCDWIREGFKKTTVSCIMKYAVVVILVIVCTVSGLLTMVREQYSGTKGANYELYNKELLDACTFIEENTPANSVILTANNHNNAVASLTGRNIVCGSSTFLYFHGFDTYNRELDVADMYSDPASAADLYSRTPARLPTISPATATSLQKSTVWPKPENSTSRSACCRR